MECFLSMYVGHSESVVSVDFNCNGTLLATGDMNGVVIIWKVENGEKIHEVQASEIQVSSHKTFFCEVARISFKNFLNLFIFNVHVLCSEGVQGDYGQDFGDFNLLIGEFMWNKLVFV